MTNNILFQVAQQGESRLGAHSVGNKNHLSKSQSKRGALFQKFKRAFESYEMEFKQNNSNNFSLR